MNPIDPYNVYWWNAAGSLVIALSTILLVLATIAQVFVTRAISRELKRSSSSLQRQENSRHINAQWQRLNLYAATNMEFATTVAKVYEADTPISDIPVRGVIFYMLNLMYDMYNADDGHIDRAFYEAMTKDHIKMLSRTNKSDLLYILETKRGYSKPFCDHIKHMITEAEAAVK